MFSLENGSKVIILGTNNEAITAYFKLRNRFDILGFMDNDATEDGVFCDKKLFTLKKMKNLGDATVVIYSPKWMLICKWLLKHNYKIFRDFLPYFMFEYEKIDICKILSVTPESDMEYVLKKMKKEKKAVLIHGNCQTIPLKLYLNNNNRFKKEFIIYDIPPLHLVNDSNKFIFESKFLFYDVSVFVSHNVSKDNRFGYFLSTQNFLDHLPKTCQVIRISNLWFAGYFPQHLGKLNSKVCSYLPSAFLWQDMNLDRMGGKEKLPLKDILKKLKNEDLYSSLYLNSLFEKNFLNMEEREKNVDVKMTDYLRVFCMKDIMFYSSNHPKNIIIKELAKRLLRYMNIYHESEEIYFDYEMLIDKTETLKITCEAVYPAVFKFLGIKDKMNKYSLNYPGTLKNRQYILFDDYIKDYLTFNYGYAYEE